MIPKGVSTIPFRLRIYVAGPLSANEGESKGPASNIKKADEAGKAIFRLGHHPYVPHTMTSTWLDEKDGCFHDYTRVVEEFDFGWLRMCDLLFLLPGWEKSRGTLLEVSEAERLCMPIVRDLSQIPRAEPDADCMFALNSRDVFTHACRRRMIGGHFKYGEATWKFDNPIDMLAEEAYDAENYWFFGLLQAKYLSRHASVMSEALFDPKALADREDEILPDDGGS